MSGVWPMAARMLSWTFWGMVLICERRYLAREQGSTRELDRPGRRSARRFEETGDRGGKVLQLCDDVRVGSEGSLRRRLRLLGTFETVIRPGQIGLSARQFLFRLRVPFESVGHVLEYQQGSKEITPRGRSRPAQQSLVRGALPDRGRKGGRQK